MNMVVPRTGVLVSIFLLQGCVVRYHDADTGVDHVYGFGHFAYSIKHQPDDLVAVATQLDTLGAGASLQQQERWLLLGVGRHYALDILDKDSCVRMEWPGPSLMDVRVGSEPPEDFGVATDCMEEENGDE